jgi:hypothetical protein
MAAVLGRDDGPEWELALDPAAAAAADNEEEDEDEDEDEEEDTEVARGVGAGLAGAHGVLGRCTWYRVRLTAAAMAGGQAQLYSVQPQ